MSPGAGPATPSPARASPKKARVSEEEPGAGLPTRSTASRSARLSAGRPGDFSSGLGDFGAGLGAEAALIAVAVLGPIEDAGGGDSGFDASPVGPLLFGAARPDDAGSSVMAMMSAAASAASAQLRATTRRAEDALAGRMSSSSAVTTPIRDVENLARTRSASGSSPNVTRGTRERTRAIRSARVVQEASAITSRRAIDAAFGGEAVPRSAAHTSSAKASAATGGLVAVCENGSIER
jgi:hypothetical protein